jgi:hypothetical protein
MERPCALFVETTTTTTPSSGGRSLGGALSQGFDLGYVIFIQKSNNKRPIDWNSCYLLIFNN